jgi:hypothetical protein
MIYEFYELGLVSCEGLSASIGSEELCVFMMSCLAIVIEAVRMLHVTFGG